MPQQKKESDMVFMRSRKHRDGPVVDLIVTEREENGCFQTLQGFIERVAGGRRGR